MKRVEASEKSLVIDILAESFIDNPSVNYVVRQDAKRKERIRRLMDYSFNVCHAFGEVWISDDRQACALALYPERKRTNPNTILWDVTLATSVIGLNRVGKVLSRESKIKAFHPNDPFCYLWFIGVKPSAQGTGKGSELLAQIINNSDLQGRPIYLETSVDRNLNWYKKHGFEIFQTLDLTYTLYLLRRNIG
jgi:ribosomal protein S18 acetylase RimI-like enzyme